MLADVSVPTEHCQNKNYYYIYMHMSNVLKAVPCLCFQARERGSTLLGLLHNANHEDQFLFYKWMAVNPLHAELNPTCHLLALLGDHHILHVSRIRVNVGALHTSSTYLTFSIVCNIYS